MPTPFALSAFADNYIWTLSAANGEAVIVDPGESEPVEIAVGQGLKPCAILLTHHHNDHIGAAARLAERYALPVYGPDDTRIHAVTHTVREGDTITLASGQMRFNIIETPGHTLSHIVFVGEGIAFTGDTLFSLGCGRLFEGTPAQMLASLNRIAALPKDTLICCGHEYTVPNAVFALTADPDNLALRTRYEQAKALRAENHPTLPTTLASELACNPFLRCSDSHVAARVSANFSIEPNDPLAVFTALRRWKDGFIAP